MRFPVLTLLNRELRLESRHWRTYVVRIVMLAVILICVYYTEQASRYMGAPGKEFFASLMTLNMVLATLAGLSVFAAAITEEKEEMTLGLMRMTALNPVTILLGKSTAKMLAVLILLAAQVPFTMLAVTMGGVSTTQIVSAYVMLGAYVVFVANAALLCSVVCRRTAWASSLMVGILVVVFLVPGWIMVARPVRMLMSGSYGAPVSPGLVHPFWLWCLESCEWWMEHGNAFAGMVNIFRSGFDGPIFSEPAGICFALGGAFFLVSLAVFNLFTRNETDSSPGRGLLARSRRGWRLFGPGRVWGRAILWKEFYFTNGGWTMMPVKLIVVILLIAGITISLDGYRLFGDRENLGTALMVWAIVFASIETVVYAARMFAGERRWNTLSSLVTLPVSARRLWYAKLLSGLPRFAPWVLMFVAGAVLAPGRCWNAIEDVITEEGTIYAGCVAAFFLHLLVWLSLKIRRWALLVAVVVMILVGIISGIVGSIDNDLVRPFVIMLGLVAGALHVMMPHAIERAAASE